jgi:hypothetical protein
MKILSLVLVGCIWQWPCYHIVLLEGILCSLLGLSRVENPWAMVALGLISFLELLLFESFLQSMCHKGMADVPACRGSP